MNRSFVLVAALGFCSLALSAPTSPNLAQRDVAAAFSGSPATPINAPEIPPAIESLRAGLSVFRRQINPTITTIPANATNATTVSTTAASGAIATQVTVINDVKPAEVQENGGAPVIDPIISGLRSGKTTFRRASSGGDNKPSGVGGVISDIVKPLEAFNPFGGAPSMNRVAQNQRTDYSKGGHFRKRNSGEEAGVPRDLSGPCSRWNAVNCRRQETANTVNKNFAGAPEFDPILEGLHDGTTVFNNGADLPKDSPLLPREPFMAQSNGAYDGAPNTDSTVEAMREGNDRFGRRQATNFAGAPEFDPILEGLRNGASVFNPSKPVPPHRREASPMGSMGSGAPSFNLGFGNFHFRRDGSSHETEGEEELDARNFGGQAIPVGGNAEALKAMWTTA